MLSIMSEPNSEMSQLVRPEHEPENSSEKHANNENLRINVH
jgi:hypothetical protein